MPLALLQTCVRAKDAAEGNKLLFTLGRLRLCLCSTSSCKYRNVTVHTRTSAHIGAQAHRTSPNRGKGTFRSVVS